MAEETEPTQCKGLTQSGERCQNNARAGSEYCGVHAAQETASDNDTLDTDAGEGEPVIVEQPGADVPIVNPEPAEVPEVAISFREPPTPAFNSTDGAPDTTHPAVFAETETVGQALDRKHAEAARKREEEAAAKAEADKE